MLLDNPHDDFEYFKEDPERYVREIEENYYENKLKFYEFMGPEFADEPLMTYDELKDKTLNSIDRVARLRELNAPDIIIEDTEEILKKLLEISNNGDYAITNKQLQYHTDYNVKLNEWADHVRAIRRQYQEYVISQES
jgi:hypothetical protein